MILIPEIIFSRFSLQFGLEPHQLTLLSESHIATETALKLPVSDKASTVMSVPLITEAIALNLPADLSYLLMWNK